MKPRGKNIVSIAVDIVILGIATLISVVLLVQHNNATSVTVDTREERYFRPVNKKIDLIYGNPNADIFIVEHGDLECEYCKEFHSNIKTLIQSNWGVSGKVAWVWRNGFHINTTSLEKGKALECIQRYPGQQPRTVAWKFIEESLAGGVHENEYPHKRYRDIMEKLEIPVEQVEECRKNNEVAGRIMLSIQDVKELDIDETPYLQFMSGEGELLFESVGVLTTSQLENFVTSILRARTEETDE